MLPQPIATKTVMKRPTPAAPVMAPSSVVAREPDPTPVAAVPPLVVVALASPAPPLQVVEAPPVATFKRRDGYSEEALRSLLHQDSRALDIETEKGASAKLLEAEKAIKRPKGETAVGNAGKATARVSSTAPIRDLITSRADLKGLTVRNEEECQLDRKDTATMANLSRLIRRTAATRNIRSRTTSSSFSDMAERDSELIRFVTEKGVIEPGISDTSLRTLVQMLQTENYPVRLQLVKTLANNKGKYASTALAQRAVFDISPLVREAAVEALKGRPSEEYRPRLLEALRYPWPLPADHAAEALVALDSHDAIFDLVNLLDDPDPCTPTQDKDKKWVVSDLVRVNHLGNCLLCHAPSSGRDDLFRAPVPERGKTLPEVYYDRGDGISIRADVTYIRQDFSVVQTVNDSGKWPSEQRFDYLVRKRELSTNEVRLLSESNAAGKPATYPQREAVLWALRELTGEDLGTKSEDWYQGHVDGKITLNR
jgi:hypothetical protein